MRLDRNPEARGRSRRFVLDCFAKMQKYDASGSDRIVSKNRQYGVLNVPTVPTVGT